MNQAPLPPTDPSELQPWLIVNGSGAAGHLASWRIDAEDALAIACFSSEAKAKAYAAANCSTAFTLVRPDRTTLIQLLAECFRQGISFAALDPTGSQARSIFRLREVLAAARESLIATRQNLKGSQP